MDTESTRARVDAVDDDGKPINNLRIGRRVAERREEWNRIVTFLHADGTEKDEGSRDGFRPQTIMVVSGPKGVGKSTLALQGARKKLDEGDVFKAIVWFDKRRFLELMHDAPDILDQGHVAGYSAPAFRQHLVENDDDYANLRQALESYRQSQPETTPQPEPTIQPHLPIIRQFFRDVQPYLLIIDDIDEDFEEQTQVICDELERIRLPNKAILTSRRAADLPFNNDHVQIAHLKLGLLSKEEADDMVDWECREYGLARQYWYADDLDQTKQWLWEYTGGLPDLIVKTIRNAEVDSKRLNTTAYWLEFFRAYAASYLQGDPTESVADLFAALNAQEKYLLVALAGVPTFPPRNGDDLLATVGVYQDHSEQESYSAAITSLYAKRFLGRKVRLISTDSRKRYDLEWQLHPFMRGLIETNLENYTISDYRRVRADLWQEYFRHYAISDESRVNLLEYLNQGMSSLAWLVEHEEWPKAITFGKTIVSVLLNSHRAGRADKELHRKVGTDPHLIEACQYVITAAEKNGNVNENAAHRLLLLKNIAYDEYPNIPHEQISGLLKLRDKFEMLESGLRGSVAAYYANIAIMEGDIALAREWLERDTGSSAHEDLLRVRLLLADQILHDGDLPNALDEAQRARSAGQRRQSQANKVDIIAHQLIAKILFRQDQLGESREAYIEAAKLAKAANYPDLANDYLKAVTLIDWSLNSNPLEDVGVSIEFLQPPSLTTLFHCSACNHKITARDLWLGQTVTCNNCPAAFHERCITEMGLSHCPLCTAPLPVVNQAQG